jgi:uncharacterized membrane protein YhdT
MSIFKIVVMYIMGWFVAAYSTMITVGILHNWWNFIPPMGYVTAIQLVALPFFIAVVMGVFNAVANS